MAVAAGLAAVRARIAAVTKEVGCSEPTLVAVSKYMDVPVVMEAYNAGKTKVFTTNLVIITLVL
jgi:uncharacterized pyridoxal phosphate-containing UPF0001 family protein